MDGKRDERREAIRTATHQARYRLLRHAATVGEFPASDAARIAGLKETTGTARWTHARALCRAGLLERFEAGSVRYRVTPDGRRLYQALDELLRERRRPRRLAHELAPGDDLEIVAPVQADAEAAQGRVKIHIRRSG